MKKYLLNAKYNIILMGLYHALTQEREAMVLSVTEQEMDNHQLSINLIEAEINEYQKLKKELKNN